MTIFNSFNISASGMSAQRLRMDIISNNLANANTTRTAEGGAYRRQIAVFGERNTPVAFGDILAQAMNQNSGNGVRVLRVAQDQSPLKMVYNPDHPDANGEGYVAMPNVNVVTEMVDMISASRSYEANVTAVNAAKSMAMKALEIGRG